MFRAASVHGRAGRAAYVRLALAAIALVGVSAVQAETLSIKVTTDRAIDCSSTRSIVDDVCAGLTTDQEKAVALLDFVRRLMFHYPNRPSRRDVSTDSAPVPNRSDNR